MSKHLPIEASVLALLLLFVGVTLAASQQFESSKLSPGVVTRGAGFQSSKLSGGIIAQNGGLQSSKLSVGIVVTTTFGGNVVRAPLTHW